MTSERRRFPVGLTLAAALGFAICGSLGVWQLQRGAWKAHVLAEVAARRFAPAQPIGAVLARAAKGEDISFTRVAVTCAPAPPNQAYLQETSDNGDWIARVFDFCYLANGPYDLVAVDRGLLTASRGQTNPAPVTLAAPAQVSGVLLGETPAEMKLPQPQQIELFTNSDEVANHPPRLAPLVLVVEHERPPAAGVQPTAFPDPASNLQYVGAYATTWFGLAGVLAGVYAAMLWRRRGSS